MSATAQIIVAAAKIAGDKDSRKALVSIIVGVLLLLAFLLGFVMWLLLSVNPLLTSQYNSALSDIYDDYIIIEEEDYTVAAMQKIHCLCTDNVSPSVSEAYSFIVNFFLVELRYDEEQEKTVAKFLAKDKVYEKIQDEPYYFKEDYLDIVYHALYGKFDFGGSNGGTLKPLPTVPNELLDSMIKPCTGNYTSPFGYRTHPVSGQKNELHTGLDIVGDWHQSILAAADGVVVSTNTAKDGYGNYIKIKHTINGLTVYTFYAHLSAINVAVGDTVKQGDKIGNEGGDPNKDINPGTSTGHHLHFEVRLNPNRNSAIDPMDCLF